jgi:hypothetical protein
MPRGIIAAILAALVTLSSVGVVLEVFNRRTSVLLLGVKKP